MTEITESAIKLEEKDVPDYVIFIYLKFKLLVAKSYKAINKSEQAHELSIWIILFVNQYTDLTPSKFWLTAVKASALIQTQFCNAREFDDALQIIEKVAMKLTEQVTDHFLPTEKPDPSKVLQDNFYVFAYRKIVTQHLIYFMDFSNAETYLRKILNEELNFYQLVPKKPEEEKKEEEKKPEEGEKAEKPAEAPVNKEEEEKKDEEPKKAEFQKIDLDSIFLDSLDNQEILNSPEHQYTAKSHPLFKVVQTLLQLAECFAFRLHT